ncbi:MAG: ribonuclease P protein component, partial [Nitrospinaceae bacterium]
MENRGFSKAERLLRRPQFERVLNGGRRCRVGRLCTLFSLPNGLGRKRLGIIASRK